MAEARRRVPVNAVDAVAASASQQPATPPSASRLAFADGLRGLAAFWVVLYHASEGGHLTQLKAALPQAVADLVFNFGHLGVPVFFVLSGFVMAFTVQSETVDRAFAFRFVLRRLVRLTPPYWTSIALVVGLLAVKARALHTGAAQPDAGVVLANATYLQGLLDLPPLNYVYWTLGVEVQFYLAFALLMLLADALGPRLGRQRARVLVFGTTSIVALLWPMGLVSHPGWPGGFAPFWFSFAAGVLVCWGWQRGGAVALGALVLSVAIAISAFIGASSFAWTAALTAAALLAAGRFGRMQTWLGWGWLQFLGAISYSLYLLHNPLTGAGFNLVRRALPPTIATELVGLAASVAICIAVSYAAYRLVEVPSQRWSRAIRLKRPARLQREFA